MGARVTVARATPTRFFCPPLSPAGMRSSKPASDTHASRSATRSRTSLLGRGVEAAQREGDVVEDRQVIEERVVLEEHPDALAYLLELELGGLGHASSPTWMVPRSGRISAVIILRRTLLPLAPGPMSP